MLIHSIATVDSMNFWGPFAFRLSAPPKQFSDRIPLVQLRIMKIVSLLSVVTRVYFADSRRKPSGTSINIVQTLGAEWTEAFCPLDRYIAMGQLFRV